MPPAASARRILIAAGGTGGHFYPGLVLAKALRERGWQPLMGVRRGDPALAALERESIPAVELDLAGLPRGLSARVFSFGWRLGASLLLARRVVRDFGPAAVVGMGGYLSFPFVWAAAWRGIPRAVHESNAVLGLSNRLCRTLGARLLLGLPGEVPGARGAAVTGTPVRPALWNPVPAPEARARLALDAERATVLVFGGSQGARGINRELPKALARAGAGAPGRLQVLHLAGAREAEEVRAAYAGAPLQVRVLEYLEAMELAYSAADLVVCRAGAGTLAELACQRRPAILIPYPHAAEGHQEANARYFERAGTAQVVLEKDLAARLPDLLNNLLFSEHGEAIRKAMEECYKKLALPPPAEASARLADAVEKMARPS